SSPGEGATFSVHVAIAARATKSAGGSDEPGLDGMRIAILDDDPLALEAVAGVLGDAGARVETFSTEETMAQAFAAGLNPDLRVLDLRIEGDLRGCDTANRTPANLTPPPPAIIITGDTGADTLAFLSASGFTWLIKPVDRTALTRAAAAQKQKQLV